MNITFAAQDIGSSCAFQILAVLSGLCYFWPVTDFISEEISSGDLGAWGARCRGA